MTDSAFNHHQADPRWRPHPDVVGRELGDEMILVQLRTNQIYELNRTGARIWALLNENLSEAEIESRLLDEFSGDQQQIAAEIRELFSRLSQEALVVRS